MIKKKMEGQNCVSCCKMEQNGINFPVASSGISANTSVWFIVGISHVEEAFLAELGSLRNLKLTPWAFRGSLLRRKSLGANLKA
jgi:hypothetical protein